MEHTQETKEPFGQDSLLNLYGKEDDIQKQLNQLDPRQLTRLKLGACVSYLLAYLYSSDFINGSARYFFVLALGLIFLVEWLGRSLKTAFPTGHNRLETSIFLAATLLQAFAFSFLTVHIQIRFFQALALHTSFIFYVAARNGWFDQNKIGLMIWYDSLFAAVALPFRHFLLRLKVLWTSSKAKAAEIDPKTGLSPRGKQLLFILSSLFVASLLLSFVWSQLSLVSDKFASLMTNFGSHISNFFLAFSPSYLSLAQLVLSLPVGMWLYGLIAGSLLGDKEQRLSQEEFEADLEKTRVFPAFTVYIIMGSLCLMYGLFFATAVTELGTLLSVQQVVPAHEASSVAVAGFWQLVRVSFLNFAVLGGFYLIADKPLAERKGTRLAATILFVFATLFALLAGWKLFGIYIYLYGPTALRLLSAWFVLVLLVWCILTLIRLYKPIQAIRIGILYAFTSFTVLCYLYPVLL